MYRMEADIDVLSLLREIHYTKIYRNVARERVTKIRDYTVNYPLIVVIIIIIR